MNVDLRRTNTFMELLLFWLNYTKGPLSLK